MILLKKYFIAEHRIYYGGMLLAVLVVMLFFLPPELFVRVGVAAAAVILLASFLLHLEWGLYAMAAVAFFTGWEIILSRYASFKNAAYLSSLNAPLIDFISVMLVAGVGLAWLLRLYRFKEKNFRYLIIPVVLYGLFLLVAWVAAQQAFDSNFALSLRYLVRFMLFSFAAFVLVPNVLIRDQSVLLRVLKIFFWVGIGIALFGLSSLLVVAQKDWLRVVPYGIGSFAPLGYNHNLIAEALIATIPVAAYLAYRAYREGKREAGERYLFGFGLMVAAELLTLSRAGWVSLFIQVGLALWLLRDRVRGFVSRHSGSVAVVGALLIASIAYLGLFLGSKIVASSTANRLATTELVLYYAARSPWLGYGPGMYRPILGNTKAYVMDFGEPLEAHGWVQKVLLEEGIIGLSLFLVFFAYLFYKLWNLARERSSQSALYLMFLAMVGGEVAFQLFNTSYFHSVLWLPVGLALAAIGLRGKD